MFPMHYIENKTTKYYMYKTLKFTTLPTFTLKEKRTKRGIRDKMLTMTFLGLKRVNLPHYLC